MSKKVGVIAGSLRKGAFSRAVAEHLIGMETDGLELSIIEINDLPLYNQDFDGSPDEPASYARFRREASDMDAYIFVTPEHNRSLPASLKNALDIGSRPYGKSVWEAKPAGVISTTPGRVGAFGANHHLRQVAVSLNLNMMQQPELYIGGVGTMIHDGAVTDKALEGMLAKFMEAFSEWVK